MSMPWSKRMADAVLRRYPLVAFMPEPKHREDWNYENGCMLSAMEQLWRATGDPRYFAYIRSNTDRFVQPDGAIKTYSLNEYNVDQVNQGKVLFLLYEQTGEEKYRKAIERLMTQMKSHPRTSEGGLWHKKIYPYQMWLDGVYMTSPLLAAYARMFGEPEWYDMAAHEMLLMERRARDPKTGLLYHGWDESREQRWADKETGCSPHVWGRAVGWFAMAAVDTLDFLPLDHRERGQIVGVFHRLAKAVLRVQDEETGLWRQVLDQGERAGNYWETSASAMFVYAFAKGARMGYLGTAFAEAARIGHRGLVERCIHTDAGREIYLDHTCKVAGLGGQPYRDGAYEYYVGEPTRRDDPKGVAPFIMASLQIEALG